MRGLYVCAFSEERTLSYLSDWSDAFASHGFHIFNAIQASHLDLARVCAAALRYDVIVLGYSCYYGLQGRRRQMLAAGCRLSRATVVGFLQNEFRNFADKVAYFDSFGVDILVSQLLQSVSEEFYSGRTTAKKILSVYHGLYSGIAFDPKPHCERAIDIGSRVHDYGIYLGNAGRAVAIPKFLEKARGDGRFVIDWETDPSQRFTREDWLDFLGCCRITVAAEAGSNFIQWTESKRHEINNLLKKAPQTSFGEVFQRFLKDDSAHLCGATVSPRHFEAVNTRTCQVLVEGGYNGILSPGEHFIELKKDASNIGCVLEQMSDGSLCEETAQRAYDHVIAGHTLDHRIQELFEQL